MCNVISLHINKMPHASHVPHLRAIGCRVTAAGDAVLRECPKHWQHARTLKSTNTHAHMVYKTRFLTRRQPARVGGETNSRNLSRDSSAHSRPPFHITACRVVQSRGWHGEALRYTTQAAVGTHNVG